MTIPGRCHSCSASSRLPSKSSIRAHCRMPKKPSKLPDAAPPRRLSSFRCSFSPSRHNAAIPSARLPQPRSALVSTGRTGRHGLPFAKRWPPRFASTAARSPAGLPLWRDVLRRFEWTGEVVQISLQLPNLADSLARRDPELAVELAAISESKAIAPFGAFDAAGYNELAGAVNRLGPKALESARDAPCRCPTTTRWRSSSRQSNGSSPRHQTRSFARHRQPLKRRAADRTSRHDTTRGRARERVVVCRYPVGADECHIAMRRSPLALWATSPTAPRSASPLPFALSSEASRCVFDA